MEVTFREFNPFNVWFWMEFKTVPSRKETELIDELFSSWFFMGKLGAFNAENMQVQETGLDLSYLDYDNSQDSMVALMHNMGEVEYLGTWGRCWFDLGTSDAISLDVLINALQTLCKEYLELDRLIIGGENEDWPIDDGEQPGLFYEVDDEIDEE
jgi:Protein of unknown function (DUF3531)